MQHGAPVGILLAAGNGVRFDPAGARNKLLQALSNGVPVAVQSAQNLRQVLERLVAVVRCPVLAAQLERAGCRSVLFAQAEQGMGASLAFAVGEVLRADADVNSIVVALADMPYIQTESIRQIVAALQAGADIVQPVYQQRPGHPVGFARRHFAALMALTGDQGARQLLRQFPATTIDMQDPGVVRDIDLIADLSAWAPS